MASKINQRNSTRGICFPLLSFPPLAHESSHNPADCKHTDGSDDAIRVDPCTTTWHSQHQFSSLTDVAVTDRPRWSARKRALHRCRTTAEIFTFL